MQLFLRSATGATSVVEASAADTVGTLRAKAGFDDTSSIFFFGGFCLREESATLAECGLQQGSTVQVMIPVEGGKGKKKKKKVFTKPKKPIHRHKLEKMRALKYFKVTENDDGSFKVERTRDECPNPNCGAGVFMAQHKGRKYCGKCHLTYTMK
ncbi:ubiquitin/ribosomal protein S27a, putative [Trypanosoma equiperdum]|uniref:Ubiquitin-ribosomal protein eL40 fusion protein n=5 Tax=Eukaryota TaxID=2759 RepID=Q57WI3_TRYB2|nr:ubiquitin/ribosomal protein S27a, putative [Trypanosoma brucei gambiense DAL972]XP_845991.1 ubiquitin/ribosomal protein S27a, putative [Trypanosoma brucei brucei TREU927]4V8M_A9 Chain A9, UBIQUITIN/RIBOSOMAL PROTEIN S27A, PUTATIVE [Trypanosoma brucei brucei TREU927]8OVA_A9 Chain A9, Ubiquitin-60S ribosomal protein L40 [Trypanosoma brucei brucei]AAX70038.1 ubiquitin/ribosomal protein S27a, putative [Trypanosoma brucei]RHW71594.1 ubiquitin/ribosomal protein S27a [Trypanosoma brucei equiperdum|eukprot:XP_011774761.1 ubiquitin/ribosomal protein S27a, putative [Trypanosoma brucei gambiense DAL972]